MGLLSVSQGVRAGVIGTPLIIRTVRTTQTTRNAWRTRCPLESARGMGVVLACLRIFIGPDDAVDASVYGHTHFRALKHLVQELQKVSLGQSHCEHRVTNIPPVPPRTFFFCSI